jgi:alginate O-acetyltransferase complex protein AlgI
VVFSSPTFLFVFLPITLFVLVFLRGRLQNGFLLLASAFFYLWGGGAAILIISAVALASYGLAWLPWDRWRLRASRRTLRLALAGSIALLLIPIFVAKYLPVIGAEFSGRELAAVVLPLGISFFTFHALSYVIDVATGSIERERRLLDYALYLFVFPHQIAGPIVRYSEIRAEMPLRREAPLPQLGVGFARFSWGLAKKTLVADPCGQLATSLFALNAADGRLTAADAWIGAVLYAFQIYFDFSGYSDMAIGLALILGFHFPENFFQPYRSISITDFWRRWHMTLSRWFRDYVYIPIGGNRRGPVVGIVALLVTFFLTALWHGAAFTFLIWGGLHAAMLLVERFTGLRRSERFAIIRRILVLVFLVVSWVPFRAGSVPQLLHYWKAMVAGGQGISSTVLTGVTPFVVLAVVVAVVSLFGPRRLTGFATVFGTRSTRDTVGMRWWLAIPATVVLFALSVVAILVTGFSPFLYFQF